jgi:hypothetical protein
MNLSFAQSKLDIYGGANFGTFRNKSFNTFAESYNTYLNAIGTELIKELKPFGTCRGYNAGIAIYPLPVGIGFSYNINHFRSHSFAELSSGKRHVEQIVNSPFNFGFPIKAGPIVFHPKFGVTRSDFKVYMEYSDGNISYGGEKLLNGVYHGFGFIGDFSIEFDLAPEDSPIALSFGGSITAGKAIYENSSGNWARTFTPTYYPDGLPLDYTQWQTTTATINYTDYDAGYADGRFLALSFFINVKLKLGNE